MPLVEVARDAECSAGLVINGEEEPDQLALQESHGFHAGIRFHGLEPPPERRRLTCNLEGVGMAKKLWCWFGRHSWTTQMAQGESVKVCSECGTTPRRGMGDPDARAHDRYEQMYDGR